MGQMPLPRFQMGRKGRGGMAQSPAQSRQTKQQDGDPDRLVQLKHQIGGRGSGIVAHPPAQNDLEQNGQRDDPVKKHRAR